MALRMHRGADVQSAGVKLLERMLNTDMDVAAPGRRRSVAAAGGIAAIAAAMSAHPDDGAVQTNACGALDGMAQSEEHRAAIAAAGGIAAMRP